ncbi:esterase-like activity of phytase family protein [uncultured Cohaesibacter sp.]|uniref:esterase-like activity of phytase family protein n=1 Tax=uncultured Cohaesibacter sp. TaxID=1002546 RepID=UPI0029C72418|nr:esterase-like activity of phytase family protein [uncultured Cohaesibacter sp.]
MLRGFLLGAVFSCFAMPALALDQLPRPAPKAQTISVTTKVLRSFDGSFEEGETFGKLVWIGGLELDSPEPLFGGFSGIAFLDAQRFLAIGDKGTALSARLVYSEGRPVGVDHVRFGFLPGLGENLAEWQRDAEGVDLRGDEALVSFEGDTRVMRYGLIDGEPRRVLGRLSLNKDIRAANRANTGLEAVAVAPDGTAFAGQVLLLSEAVKDGRVRGWILSDEATESFSLPQSGDLLATDAAFTADGDLLVLERSFSLLGGLVIEVRRVRAKDLVAGRIEAVDTLLRATLSKSIDNMEGIAVQSMPDGNSLVTLISDDNLSAFQRTLLLQFMLPAGQ